MIRRQTTARRPAVVDVLQFRQGRSQPGDRLPAVHVQRYLDQRAPGPGIRVVLAGGLRPGTERLGGDVIDGEPTVGGLGQDIAQDPGLQTVIGRRRSAGPQSRGRATRAGQEP